MPPCAGRGNAPQASSARYRPGSPSSSRAATRRAQRAIRSRAWRRCRAIRHGSEHVTWQIPRPRGVNVPPHSGQIVGATPHATL